MQNRATPVLEAAGPPVILKGRNRWRRTLNEDEFVSTLSSRYSLAFPSHPYPDVQILCQETHIFVEMICAVMHARIMVGMHGDLLALHISLLPARGLTELFPFFIVHENYTS